ncbi:protein-glutamate O-methyltransferase CheR [Desulfopila sp. IMCC35008]|uniref:CheR family methyltransferase n=1 Tax=Desulfopila sp. IMCC35008 TaxID=2653858 RepID=UPI0013D14E57|nr:CheR family methyltransferase [Desulfopila sp. IMCC35008]
MLTDSDFRVLLACYERSWQGYRKVRKGPMKRVRKHMEALGCNSVKQYLDTLAKDQAEEEVLLSILRITISRFFRDRKLWTSLADTVFPALLAQTDKVKIWSAGCSCGEEVYSLSILYHMRWSDCSRLAVIATDANGSCLERARKGIYQKSSLRELDSQLLSSCFIPSGRRGEYCILPLYRKYILWRHHDFFTAPPDRGFHVIFLRNNLLTYYNSQAQSVALGLILQSLLPGGYLITGSREVLPETPCNLVATKNCDMIYQMRE